MKPSIGRIVHYVAYGTPGGEYKAGAHRAAIITEVHNSKFVNLAILNPTGLFFAQSVCNDEYMIDDPSGERGPAPGTWHWPERE